MEHAEELKGLLKLKDEMQFLLSTREGSRIEYKENFNFSSLASYAKTMAGQANNNGGYILFGIKDAPREVVGLLNSRFDEIDPVRVTRFLNANFNPEIQWEMDIIDFHGKKIGFIYSQEASKKPIICTSNNGSDLHEARIYYRYRGLTTDIKYPELRKIFDEIIENERKAWLQSLERLAKVGPENVLLMDLLNKEMVGKHKSYIIDESLIEKIKFIKSGSFNENDGEPSLRLLGDVVQTSSISVSRTVPVSIDFDSLIIAFLSNRSMSKEEAVAYLKESFNQNTINVPMFYFVKMAEIGLDEVESILTNIRNLSRYHIEKIEKRIANVTAAKDFQIEPELQFAELPMDRTLIREYINGLPTNKAKRKAIIEVFEKQPGYALENIENIEANVLLQAISESTKHIILFCKEEIFKIMLNLFMDEYIDFESSEKTIFRRAVTRLDDVLFG